MSSSYLIAQSRVNEFVYGVGTKDDARLQQHDGQNGSRQKHEGASAVHGPRAAGGEVQHHAPVVGFEGHHPEEKETDLPVNRSG